MVNKLLRGIVLMASLVLTMGAGAMPFSAMYVFGDSLSDNGNDLNLSSAIHGVNPAFPIVPGAPADLPGRFSNGKVAVEYLAGALGLPLTPHYVTPPFLGGLTAGNNYAQGGATTGLENASLPATVSGLPTGFKGTTAEINDYRSSVAAADPSALYVVWAGPNDFIHPGSTAILPSCVASPSPSICTGVTNVVNDVALLAGMGASHILVPNMPDLGVTPLAINSGTTPSATALSVAFDANLAAGLLGISSIFPGVIIPFDVFSLVDLLVANPAAFGFSDVTHSCLSGSSADSASIISAACAAAGPGQYLFWDDVHPTTQADMILAAGFERALGVPEPASVALLALGLAMLVTLRARC